MKARILEAQEDPHLLEVLYRSNPQEFIDAFQEAYLEKPDSELLQFWQERLSYNEALEPVIETKKPAQKKVYKNVLIIVIFCLLGGLLAKLQSILPIRAKDSFDEVVLHYYERNISFFFLPFIAFYYLIQRKVDVKKWILILGLIVLSALYINLLPNYVFPGKINPMSDTLILACIHLPFFLWFIGGLSFITPDFANLQNRLAFLRLNGEILIYTALILLGGIVLTGITMVLFGVVDIDIEQWYFEWIVIIGSVSAPIVATALVFNKGKKILNLAPLLSKIFTPLFMITLIGFLVMICIKLKNSILDRDFLIVINILLLVIVAIGTFVVIDRSKTQPINLFDYITLLLLSSAFIVELIALYSIVIRLTTDGFTPNRVALIGINLILLVHLTGMIVNIMRWLTKKAELVLTLDWIAKFIPVYFYWAGFMVFIYPWLFGLR